MNPRAAADRLFAAYDRFGAALDHWETRPYEQRTKDEVIDALTELDDAISVSEEWGIPTEQVTV